MFPSPTSPTTIRRTAPAGAAFEAATGARPSADASLHVGACEQPRSDRPTASAHDSSALDAVTFDRLGRSHDYAAEIATSGVGGAFRVSGLTGWIEEAP